MTWAQLDAIGVSSVMLQGWLASGYATRTLPRVYAIGHLAPSDEARLWDAVLYAGPGAMLSHVSAAFHRELLRYPPRTVQVSTPRKRVRSLPGRVEVHSGRQLARDLSFDLPVTTAEQTVFDLAATAGFRLVRRALANLDYQHRLDAAALEAACGRGIRGSAQLRRALKRHQRGFAYTKSDIEDLMIEYSERWRIPVPVCNVIVHGIELDAYWPQYRLVVELDGDRNHSQPAQVRTDRDKELTLRSHGLTVVRYSWEQMIERARDVRVDLLARIDDAQART